MTLMFDIETGPLPDKKLQEIYQPPDMPEPPGEFDEKAVKVGNLKDPEKIAAKIDEAKQRWEQSVLNHEKKRREVAEQGWKDFKSSAPLDAVTGQVLAIGYYNPDSDQVYIATGGNHGGEQGMIAGFWGKCDDLRSQHRNLVGLNIFDFDLPFLIRRSWMLGLTIPSWLIRQDRFFDDTFIDLRRRWLCGQYAANCKSNFDHLAAAFSSNGKPEGVDGSQFATLWETDREKAIEYLTNDLKQPAEWAKRMGVI